MKDRTKDWFGNFMIKMLDGTTKHPIISIIMLIVFVILLGYGGWHLKRWVNWELAYGDDVKLAVCEMVKPEALKDPSVCENDE
ncbi:hypothetical protein LCGC14_0669200 [marine sediment metagenome]|uniref:Uncharacterized protein n=1 Tax=marine sediment metagenome TaxID=412755 RepID=A0A0F9RBK5_9ZZZZ